MMKVHPCVLCLKFLEGHPNHKECTRMFHLDYNILLGHSYMYAMKEVDSLLFCNMMFSFNGNIVTLNQLNYYEPQTTTNPKKILPIVGEVNQPPYIDVVPGV